MRGPRGAWAIRLEFLHMKLRIGLAAFASLALAAGCTMAAKEEDDALVKAGFAKDEFERTRSGLHRKVEPDRLPSFCASYCERRS